MTVDIVVCAPRRLGESVVRCLQIKFVNEDERVKSVEQACQHYGLQWRDKGALSYPPVTPTGSFHFAPHATIKTGNPEKKRRKVSENDLVTNWKLSPRVKNGRGSAEGRHELP